MIRFSIGFCKIDVKNFTVNPVSKALNIVPSLVPIILFWNSMSDNKIDRITQSISKPILIFPKFLFVFSETAFTKASPEFMITFAITDKEMPNPKMIIPNNTKIMRMLYLFAGIDATHHIPKSVKYPNKNESGICNNCIFLKFFLRSKICPKIKIQFHIMSHVPREKEIYLQLSTLATDEMGDTPSSPCFVTATPKAAKNKLIINKIYLLVSSSLFIFIPIYISQACL